MLTEELVKFGPKFFEETLPQTGHDGYTPFLDAIDNPLEPDVKAKNIRVNFMRDKNAVKSIFISDDGFSMDTDKLHECMRFGSETGKTKKGNIGGYGCGVKVAGLTIGRRVTIFARQKDSDVVNIASVDLDNMTPDGPIVTYESVTKDDARFSIIKEYAKSNHGTVVMFDKLKDPTNKDFYKYRNTLKRRIRMVYNKFIEVGEFNFYVDDEKLTFLDPIGIKSGIGTELLGEGEFTYGDNKVKVSYKAYQLPNNADRKDGENTVGRLAGNSGFWIYRHRRLIGQGRDLGICQRAGHETVNLRIELYVDGEADDLLGTSFTKLLEKDTIVNQGFSDKLQNEIGPYVRESVRRYRENGKANIDENQKKIFDRTTKEVNENPFLLAEMKQKGRNEKPNNPKPKNPNPKPQKNPNPHRTRTGAWFGGYKTVSLGPMGTMYYTAEEDGLTYVHINKDHVMYKTFFSSLQPEQQAMFSKYLVADALAKKDVLYYSDGFIQTCIDKYNEAYGIAVWKAFDKTS